MANYLYPALGGSGGGGGVATVTASVPLFSSGGANPNITITQNFYDVGTDWPYATIAAAIAAAVGAGDSSATIRINQDITEDVTLPRGMTLTGQAPPGNSSRRLTGRLQSSFAAGISNVTGLTLIGNGTQEIFNANAAGSFWFTNCTFAQGSDFPIGILTAGGTAALSNCNFIATGIATAYAFTSVGTLSLRNCSGLTIPSGLFLNQTGGGLTTDGAIISGSLNVTGGGLNLKYSNFGVTALYGLNLTSGTPGVIQDCNFSSTSGDNVIQGTGTISYKNLGFTNTQKGIDATITLTPYTTAINTVGYVDAGVPFTGTYEFGINKDGGLNPIGIGFPSNSAFRIYGNASQIFSFSEKSLRATTNASIGSTPSSLIWEVSGNVSIPTAAEFNNIFFNLAPAGGQNFDSGTLVLQREFLINTPEYNGTAPGTTFTSAVGFAVSGPPDAGANATVSLGVGILSGSKTLSVDSSISIAAIPNNITNGKGNVGIVAGISVYALSAVALGDQTATLQYATSAYFPAIQYSSVTNTRTITRLATVYIAGAPTTSGTVAVTNGPYALWVDANAVRFDGRVLLNRFTGTPAASSLTLPSDGYGGTLTGNVNIDYIDTTGWTTWSETVVNFTGSPTINHNSGAVPGGYAAILCDASANMACSNGTFVRFRYDGTNFYASYERVP